MPKPPEKLNAPKDSLPRLEDILAEFSGEQEDNVVEFPAQDLSVTARLGRLLKRADDYAEGMFREEERDPEELRAERLIPGVDWERDTLPPPPRRPRPLREVMPDTPPAELARGYVKGLPLLRLRTALCFLLALPLVYLAAAAPLGLPLPAGPGEAAGLYLSGGLLAAVCVLSGDLFSRGMLQLVRLRLEWETLAALAALAALADAFTMPRLGMRDGMAPYCAAAALTLCFGLLGRFHKRRGLYRTAKLAAALKEPYAVTLDPDQWNHRDAYTKHTGTRAGYGSQLQSPDGVQRVYHIAAPLLLIAGVLFALLASAEHPERLLWALSANLCAAAGLSGGLAFALPFSLLAQRLVKSGIALGGWDGMRDARRAVGIVLTDTDLFPPGAVSFNGIKVFGDFEMTDILSCTATLIRGAGSGLDSLFGSLVRTQGAVYRPCDGVTVSEGGCEAVLGRRRVWVGTAAYMALMEVELPRGLSVKNAVFCAIDGELAGIFALNYALHGAVRPALGALLANRMPPILATRDPSIIPAMLRQRFKLPVERMEFPSVERRRELSNPNQERGAAFAALLGREGVAPYAEAVVGSRRLATAARLAVICALLGAAAGLLLCFYLTGAGAYASLTAFHLLVFLSLWLVPMLLIAGWVNRY